MLSESNELVRHPTNKSSQYYDSILHNYHGQQTQITHPKSFRYKFVGVTVLFAFCMFLGARSLANNNNDENEYGMSTLSSSITYPLWGSSRYETEYDRKYGSLYLERAKKKFDSYPTINCEGTVMIIRHCEFGNVREHCDYAGFERSVYFATLFGDDDERWPTPSYLYATNPGYRKEPGKRVFRDLEVLAPLSNKFNITVNDKYGGHDSKKLAKEILRKFESGDMCGKLAVISWKHAQIPNLAQKLGCFPPQGCPLDYSGFEFDQAWQIKFVFRHFQHSERKSLKPKKGPEWKIFGSVQSQNFDPLSFSNTYGDYPKDGTPFGGRWMKDTDPLSKEKETDPVPKEKETDPLSKEKETDPALKEEETDPASGIDDV